MPLTLNQLAELSGRASEHVLASFAFASEAGDDDDDDDEDENEDEEENGSHGATSVVST